MHRVNPPPHPLLGGGKGFLPLSMQRVSLILSLDSGHVL